MNDKRTLFCEQPGKRLVCVCMLAIGIVESEYFLIYCTSIIYVVSPSIHLRMGLDYFG
jgi:hypothetical protein